MRVLLAARLRLVSIDAAGNLWVSDGYNQRVQELTPNGEFITQCSYGSGEGQFFYPSGVAVAAGWAYIVDHNNNRVEKWGVLE